MRQIEVGRRPWFSECHNNRPRGSNFSRSHTLLPSNARKKL
jgi:hypothetical protein